MMQTTRNGQNSVPSTLTTTAATTASEMKKMRRLPRVAPTGNINTKHPKPFSTQNEKNFQCNGYLRVRFFFFFCFTLFFALHNFIFIYMLKFAPIMGRRSKKKIVAIMKTEHATDTKSTNISAFFRLLKSILQKGKQKCIK